MANLFTHKVPPIVLHVDDQSWTGEQKDFPCAALDYTIAIDNIPTATVYVAIGNYLRDGVSDYKQGSSCSPQDLLCFIQERSKQATRQELFSECHITYGEKEILHGYIVSGSYQYTTKGSVSMMICFVCMWSGVLLMTKPVSGYMDVNMGSIIKILQGKDNLDQQAAMYSGQHLTQAVNITESLKQYTKNMSILNRLCICVGALLSHVNYDENKLDDDNFTSNLDCFKTFGGSWRLRTEDEGISPAADGAFTELLWHGILQGLQSSDLFTSILRTLTSENFGLQLVPRISDPDVGNFKMEICPITAWMDGGAKDTVIPLEYVVQLRSVHNVLDRLNEPEVLIVNGGATYGFTVSDVRSGIQGLYGIYCVDKELCATMQDSIGRTELPSVLKKFENCRVHQMYTPAWVDIAGCSKSNNSIDFKEQDNREKSDVVQQPENTEKSKETGEDKALINVKRDLTEAFKLYNKTAELLFLLYFRASDTAVIEITTDAAFGGNGANFENELGYTVGIMLSKDDLTKTNLNLYGCLRAVNYKFSAADSSSATYTLTLDRVRMGVAKDDLLKTTTSPIYTKG